MNSLGLPLIEREEISVEFKELWVAYKLGVPHEDNPESGPTPLISALRCYVTSKMGDTIEIPGELLQGEK